jgi:CBS domain containing-hemolysin-like protein
MGAIAEPALAHLLTGPLHAVGLPDGSAHTVSFVTALSIVVFLHMVVGEMVPKNLAIALPDRSALWLAVPMRWFITVFRPAVGLLNTSSNGILRLLGVEPRDALSEARTGEEIADVLAISRREGLLEEVEHRLMTGALRFPVREVRSVMVPRESLVAVGAASTPERVEQVAVETGHSRILVYGRSIDDVLGFVHAKDLLGVDEAARRRPLPSRLVRRMLMVPSTQTLDQALLGMRRARIHVAVVVEDGHTAGLVSLEDLLESLVGDIRDEHDAGTAG